MAPLTPGQIPRKKRPLRSGHRGRFVPGSLRYLLTRKRSRIHGHGAFAASPIPARRKIGEIGGELISIREARRAARLGGELYVIDISDRIALDCRHGNLLSNINHSCEPNAYMRIAHGRVEVYALRRIAKGEEITIDYSLAPDPGGMKCRCTSPNCRTRI